MNITINDVKEWIEAHEHPDITTYSHEALKFLLSEIEGLQNTIAQMQYAEQMIYECRMKGGDAVRHLLDNLLAENKQLKTEVELLEKENAALREVVEAAKAYMGSVDVNFQYAKGSLIELNDALEKIKGKI